MAVVHPMNHLLLFPDPTWEPKEWGIFLYVGLNLYSPVPGQLDLNSDLSRENGAKISVLLTGIF